MQLSPWNATALVALLAAAPVSAALVWDDGGDNVSVFSENNWTDNAGVPGTNPRANSVNGATTFLLNLAVSMSDGADLVLTGGGIPLNATTIDLAVDWTGAVCE